MRINNNLMAMNTHRQLGLSNSAGAKSMSKLSSGYRINSASDDAAGLAISEKMRGQIRGLNQASRNSQDAISMIQTAEGALNETHAILQRMRELAVQSATDTNTDADRGEIQKEITQLTSEIDRISTDTEFNTKKLLDGSIENSATVDATNAASLVGANIVDDNLVAGDYAVTVSAVTVDIADFADSGTNADAVDLTTPGAGIEAGSYTLTTTMNGSNVDVSIADADGNVIGTAVNQANTGDIAVTITGGGSLTLSHDGTNNFAAGEVTFNVDVDATFSVADPDGAVIGATTVTDNNSSAVSVGGLEIEFDSTLTAAASTFTVATNAVKFQIGANEDQETALAIGDMSSEALEIDAIDLSTRDGASAAITTINDALETVSSERAKLGAVQNRLEHTIKNLDTSSENLQASESRIRDVDMAKEMMEFTKNNILQQAAQAMLAQANQAPQGVLQLLR